jgi:hypothetical protein
MKSDRTEFNDLSEECPSILDRTISMCKAWAINAGVLPWLVVPTARLHRVPERITLMMVDSLIPMLD